MCMKIIDVLPMLVFSADEDDNEVPSVEPTSRRTQGENGIANV